ncbi:Cytochrome b6-f complex iron-sulfur subunit [Planctomycetes bacterium Pan216]|uniref:Cytochrome b6-f complex iron-sulfur subunit n=1 Tax=Kolteria novifilia TaxID=2527975 RepID=A0A518BA60_9BACT|nr:Cytochrome b6-f complex iron-sulfur subunit [Planctomycetes bacterium Pan216]
MNSEHPTPPCCNSSGSGGHGGSGDAEVTLASITRRGILLVSGALFALAGLILAIPLVGYIIGPIMRRKEDQWVDIGALEDFPENQTLLVDFEDPDRRPWDGMTGKTSCYVRRLQGENFQVFSINCAHLGCPVHWFPESGLFMCPCHGGVYYEDGGRASGPPPRGLYEYAFRLEKGRMLVRAGHLPTLQDTMKETS